jgi:hypothetical protein
MRNFPCYFCQRRTHQEICSFCSSKDGIQEVVTCYAGSPSAHHYAHIYVGDKAIETVDHYDYHIRLNIICLSSWIYDIHPNTTTIHNKSYYNQTATHNLVITLPGYPLNPDNVIKKLKTILTFL